MRFSFANLVINLLILIFSALLTQDIVVKIYTYKFNEIEELTKQLICNFQFKIKTLQERVKELEEEKKEWSKKNMS